MSKHKNEYRHRQMSVPLTDEEVKCLNEIKTKTGQAKSFYVAASIRERLIKDGLLEEE